MAKAQVIPLNTINILESHFGEVAFLWYLRSVALEQFCYLPADLEDIEQRIDRAIDKLVIKPDSIWHLVERELRTPEPGKIFAAAIVAFRSLENNKIQYVVEAASKDAQLIKGLVSALAWLPSTISSPWLEKFLKSKDLTHKYVAIATYGSMRKDPLDQLDSVIERDDCKEDTRLFARTLRVIGELKRVDHIETLRSSLSDKRSEVAFWAAWAASILGINEGIQALEPYVLNVGDNQARAIQLYFRAASVEQSKRLIAKLIANPHFTRHAIQAAGVLGDPQAMSWLLQQMENTKYARVASESFSIISGIFLEENNLALEVPDIDHLRAEITEVPLADLDPDESLPWPDVEKVKAVWQKYGGHFNEGKRYFLGRPIMAEHLKKQYTKSFQRCRIAAAIELALHDREAFLNAKSRLTETT